MKNKNNIKTLLIALAACFMSSSVILSSAHAKDLVKVHSNADASSVMAKSIDINAKVISDLHNHIDKQMLKSIVSDNPVTARQRELKALAPGNEHKNLLELFEEIVMFYRVVLSLRVTA